MRYSEGEARGISKFYPLNDGTVTGAAAALRHSEQSEESHKFFEILACIVDELASLTRQYTPMSTAKAPE